MNNSYTYSQAIANSINEYLTNDDWNFSFDEQRGRFEFGLSVKGKLKNIKYTIKVRSDDYIVHAYSPMGADEDDPEIMAEMAEFICRANYGISYGSFEFDFRDGEIRFKCFVDCEGITPTPEMIRNSIHFPASMFKRYGPGIVDVIFSNASAEDAITKCEDSLNTDVRSLLQRMAEAEVDSELKGKITSIANSLGVFLNESEPSEDEADTDEDITDEDITEDDVTDEDSTDEGEQEDSVDLAQLFSELFETEGGDC